MYLAGCIRQQRLLVGGLHHGRSEGRMGWVGIAEVEETGHCTSGLNIVRAAFSRLRSCYNK
jgi:hypothetical protein